MDYLRNIREYMEVINKFRLNRSSDFALQIIHMYREALFGSMNPPIASLAAAQMNNEFFFNRKFVVLGSDRANALFRRLFADTRFMKTPVEKFRSGSGAFGANLSVIEWSDRRYIWQRSFPSSEKPDVLGKARAHPFGYEKRGGHQIRSAIYKHYADHPTAYFIIRKLVSPNPYVNDESYLVISGIQGYGVEAARQLFEQPLGQAERDLIYQIIGRVSDLSSWEVVVRADHMNPSDVVRRFHTLNVECHFPVTTIPWRAPADVIPFKRPASQVILPS